MNTKIRIVHIHTDAKFIHNIENFLNEKFENEIFFIGKKVAYRGKYENKIQYFRFSKRSYQEIIRHCSKVNIVVLYNLNFCKAYIANRLPQEITVVWRFFGTELYLRIHEDLHSQETLNILQQGKRKEFRKKIRHKLGRLGYILKFQVFSRKEIDKAIFSRADFFLGLVGN